jgi:hypothetical protein
MMPAASRSRIARTRKSCGKTECRFMSCVISGEISKSCRAFDSWRMKAPRCISILFTARKCAGGSPRNGLATNARITCLSRKKPESVAAQKEKLLYLTRRNVPASRSSIKLPRHETGALRGNVSPVTERWLRSAAQYLSELQSPARRSPVQGQPLALDNFIG